MIGKALPHLIHSSGVCCFLKEDVKRDGNTNTRATMGQVVRIEEMA